MIDNNLNICLKKFIEKFHNEDKLIKQQVHFYSTLNITNKLLVIKNKRETKKYKETVIEYFNTLESLDLPIDKLISLKIFKKYLFESGRYLMYKSNFKSNTDLQRNIIFGIIVDLFLLYFGALKFLFFIPFFTIIYIFISMIIKKRAINEARFFNYHY